MTGPSDWHRFFCPTEAANRAHSQSYVEDLLTISGQKRCAKMAWLN
nr:secretion protein HlyD [uncultured Selenomonas sp.]